MQTCARELLYIAACHDFNINAKHISTTSNILPDLLSRWTLGDIYIDQFWQRVAGLSMTQVPVPTEYFDFVNEW